MQCEEESSRFSGDTIGNIPTATTGMTVKCALQSGTAGTGPRHRHHILLCRAVKWSLNDESYCLLLSSVL